MKIAIVSAVAAAIILVTAIGVILSGQEDQRFQYVETGGGMVAINGTIEGLPHQCAHCHFGYFTPWQENMVNNNYELRPFWNPVYAVQVLQGDDPAVLSETGAIRRTTNLAQTATVLFDVPDNTRALYVRMHGSPSANVAPVGQQTQNPIKDYVTHLTLRGPGGEEVVADGPEEDLKIVVHLDPTAGQWQLQGSFSAGDAPQADLVFLAEALNGNVTPLLADPSERVTVNVTEETRVRARPYTDHRDFEPMDWDGLDISPYMRTLWLQNDTYTPTPRDEPVRDSLTQIGSYAGHWRNANMALNGQEYGFGTTLPSYFKLAQQPVRNVTALDAVLTWSPAIPMEVGVRYSSGASPLYQEAELLLLEPGRALLEIHVAPEDWDPPGANPCLNQLPGCQFHSFWDFAPHIWPAPSQPTVTEVEWQLVVTAAT